MADKHIDNFIRKIQEINVLVGEWYEADKNMIGDRIEDLLISAYLEGIAASEDYLDYKPNKDVDIPLMFDTINKKIAGKTFRERVDEYSEEEGSLDEIVRVAETEFHRVYNEGIINGGNRIGYETGRLINKQWLTVQDDKVRETHEYLEGMTVPLNAEFFTFDGDHALTPGGFEKAENNVNCRCVTILTSE